MLFVDMILIGTVIQRYILKYKLGNVLANIDNILPLDRFSRTSTQAFWARRTPICTGPRCIWQHLLPPSSSLTLPSPPWSLSRRVQ